MQQILEKSIETKLKKEVEKMGGLCLKWVSPGFSGVPDRKCLLPGGFEWLVETKKPKTGVLSERQKLVHGQLRALGFKVDVVWSMKQLNDLLTRMYITTDYDL